MGDSLSLDDMKYGDLLDMARERGMEVRGNPARKDVVAFLEESDDPSEKLSGRLAAEHVRFKGNVGWIRVRNCVHQSGGPGETSIVKPGLRVTFGEDSGRGGGLSRAFDPNEDEHDEFTNECSCKHCLADVREWIKKDRHGLAARFQIEEFNPVVGVSPLPRWHDMNGKDIAEAYRLAGFTCSISDAMRYEKAKDNRPDVIAALDELDAVADAVVEEDLATVELEAVLD